jgi:hypothetical protein
MSASYRRQSQFVLPTTISVLNEIHSDEFEKTRMLTVAKCVKCQR